MKRTLMATALRIHCAERTRAMQLACMCASRLVPAFHITFVSGMTWGTSMILRICAVVRLIRCVYLLIGMIGDFVMRWLIG